MGRQETERERHGKAGQTGELVPLGKRELALLDQLSTSIAETTEVPDLIALRKRAEAIRRMAQVVKVRTRDLNRIVEQKLRCERKIGGILASLPLWGGDRRSRRRVSPLKEMGITRDESKLWQKFHCVPDDAFEQFLRRMDEENKLLTAEALKRFANAFVPKPSTGDEDTTSALSDVVDGDGPTETVPTRPADQGTVEVYRELVSLIHEATNHCMTANRILQPNRCTSKPIQNLQDLRPAEIRALRHYLTSLDDVLRRIGEQVVTLGEGLGLDPPD